MPAEVAPIISFLAQRIVAAPSSVEPPRPLGREVAQRRYREGLILEPQLRQELASLGYTPIEVASAGAVARLDREFDIFQDRLRRLEEAFQKDLLTFAEMKSQLLALIPDTEKALVLVDLYDFSKRPKPKLLTPEEPPTLTVGQLVAAFRANTLTEAAYRAELRERGYPAEDIDLLVATEIARRPKPKPPEVKVAPLGDLRAMLGLGILTAQEFLAELLERRFPTEDAQRMLGLELARIRSRVRPHKPEEFAALPIGDLKAMFALAIITEPQLRAELRERRLSPEDIEREVALILARLLPPAPAP